METKEKEITYVIDIDSFGWQSTFWFTDGTEIDDTFRFYNKAAQAKRDGLEEARELAKEYKCPVLVYKWNTHQHGFDKIARY